jgi:Zn-finger nucleic acid-binding protein
MKCPVCKEPDLVMSERQGVEIDYCPTCRGVWLDRGELDKIIEKSVETTPGRAISGEVPPLPPDSYYGNHGYEDDHNKHGGHHGWKKKSWLGDLFD